jgi:hypothetical protein
MSSALSETKGAQDALQRRAEAIAAGARRARVWIGDVRGSAQSVANEAESLIEEARRAESLARKLARSAGRRMCVGVYGASQQGKSYLVSVLARPPGKSELRVRLGGETRDFVREINPQGGKESTGLVTRFSTAPSDGPQDDAHPVELLLLTETDFVKILANSFQSDFDQNNVQTPPPKGDAVRAALAAAEKRRGKAVVAPHLDEIVVSELAEYFRRNFRNRWQDLEPVGYWSKVIELLPMLPIEARADVYSVLWGGIEEFTAMFRLLAGALERLGHPDEVLTEMRALIPRDTSIIDVATLEQQLGTKEDENDRLAVRARKADQLGAVVELPRAVLTALIAELRITVDESPWPMFEHTDLLDFPGARSRLKLVALPSDAEERTILVRRLLLRGKIAYLFQRYSEERELTAMLLCMGNKQNEVPDLGTLVQQWLDLTHGSTSAARRQIPTALFLVLTMMDLEFLPKAGETEEALAKKWDIRLHASLYEPYARGGWVDDFDGKPFNNTVMLRNPNFRQDHLIEYELEAGTEQPKQPLFEIGVSKRNRAYIDSLERSFVQSEKTATYVADPRAVWDSIFAMNDGGVRYIVEKLTAVSNPDLKLGQVAQRLRDGIGPLHANLNRFYFGLDEAARREKEGMLRQLRSGLQKAFRPRGFRPFPRFLEALMVSERDLREIALNVASMRIDPAAPEFAAEPEEEDDIFSASRAVVKPKPRADRPAAFGRLVTQYWIGVLRRLPQDTALLESMKVPARLANDIADQLIIGAERLRLGERIAERVREATDLAALRWDDVADRIVAIALYQLNAFVAELGFHDMPLDERPGFPEGDANPERRVFAPMPDPGRELPMLGDTPETFEVRRFVDWGIGFLAMGTANLSFGGGRELSEVQNRALGEILHALATE